MAHFRSNENTLISNLDNTPPSHFAHKRGSVRRAIEASQLVEKHFADLASLGPRDIEQIIREVGFFQEHPDITDQQIAQYFDKKAEFRVSVAEIVREKGRKGLEEILSKLSKETIN